MSEPAVDQKQRVALVTGANRGLGLEAARRLADENCTVWLGMRDIRAAEALLPRFGRHVDHIHVVALDVTDADHIANVQDAIGNRHGKLDILINNAAIMLDGSWSGNTVLSADQAMLKRTFETNFFGTVALTQALWPLLVRSGQANVVNVSSRMGSNTLHADPDGPLRNAKPFAYNASKAALNMFTTHLAALGAPLGVQVNSAYPGWVRTGLGTEQAALSVEEGVETIIDLALLPPHTRTARFEQLGKSIPW